MTELFITTSIVSVTTTSAPPTPVTDKSPVLEIFPTPWTVLSSAVTTPAGSILEGAEGKGRDEVACGGDGVASPIATAAEVGESAVSTTTTKNPSSSRVESQPPPLSPTTSSSSFVSVASACQSRVELGCIRAPRPSTPPIPPPPVHTSYPPSHSPPDPRSDPTWWRYFYTSPPPNARPRRPSVPPLPPRPQRSKKGRIQRRVQGAWADVARVLGAGCLWMLTCCGRCSRYRDGGEK